MGMFDSLYDAAGVEWQTKAYACLLNRYEIGDELPDVLHVDYQVKVFGGPEDNPFQNSYATVEGGRLKAVPSERDEDLALMDYGGGWLDVGVVIVA